MKCFSVFVGSFSVENKASSLRYLLLIGILNALRSFKVFTFLEKLDLAGIHEH